MKSKIIIRLQQLFRFHKGIRTILVWICAFLLEYFYIVTDYKKAHHAFAVVFMVACIVVSFTFYIENIQGLTRYEIILSFCCGFVLSGTSFAGVLTKDEYFYSIGTCSGIIQAVAYLGLRIFLLGMFSLCLFQWLTGRRKNCKGGGKLYFGNGHFKKYGQSLLCAGCRIVLCTFRLGSEGVLEIKFYSFMGRTRWLAECLLSYMKGII